MGMGHTIQAVNVGLLQRPRGAARALRPSGARPARAPPAPSTRASQTRGRVGSRGRDRPRRAAPPAAAASRVSAARPAAYSASLHAQPAPVPGAASQAQACGAPRKRRPRPAPQPRVSAASAKPAPIPARAPAPPSSARLAARYLAAARACLQARDRFARRLAVKRATARLPRTTGRAFTSAGRAPTGPGRTFSRALAAPACAGAVAAFDGRLALAALAAPGGDSASAAQRLLRAAASLPANERALSAAFAGRGVRHVDIGGGPARNRTSILISATLQQHAAAVGDQ
ncbi:hypothetical protein HF086_013908 [Spodoptera exigua]|uniref:Uncharacterized protein n=1 Tax=Spodoptera exigua TaxID=7107 RepID=A0A922MHL7_SPOEX|nr:hypothetical protein HF086_013908 [Spodoptera exigua]